jgi:hypothetical protein
MVLPKHSDLHDVNDIMDVFHCLRLKTQNVLEIDLSLSSDGKAEGEHAVMGPSERERETSFC